MPSRRSPFVALIAALAVTTMYPPGASALTDDASAIVAKHAAYVGQPQGLVLTYRYTATPKATPAPTPTPKAGEENPVFPPRSVTTYRRGELYREVITGGGVTQQQGFTGRAFWAANINGYSVVEYEQAARRRYTSNLIDGDLLANVAATSRGTKTVDGVAVDIVRLAPTSGVPADIAFDRATGAYVQVTLDPDDPYSRTTVNYDGYTEAAPGVRVPTGFHAGEFGKWTLVEKAVRAVTNEDLRGPVPSAKWDFVSSDTSPIEIVEHQSRYAFMPRGQAVHVHATIDGQVGTFLLDSGASSIVLYRPYADRIRYTKLGATAFGGVNGRGVAARLARVDSIQVGKNTLHNVVVAVAGGAFAGGIDGILGYDLLAGALVDVDTANRTIRFLDPSVMQPVVGPGAYAFTVNLASRQPEIALKVSGVPTRAIFDTGDDFLAMLSDDLQSSGRVVSLTDRLKIGNDSVEYRIGFYGVDGPSEVPAKCSRLGQLEVGPYRYQNVETCFASAKVFGRDGGLIGFDFLKHFNWTFDYVESKLVLTPNGK